VSMEEKFLILITKLSTRIFYTAFASTQLSVLSFVRLSSQSHAPELTQPLLLLLLPHSTTYYIVYAPVYISNKLYILAINDF